MFQEVCIHGHYITRTKHDVEQGVLSVSGDGTLREVSRAPAIFGDNSVEASSLVAYPLAPRMIAPNQTAVLADELSLLLLSHHGYLPCNYIKLLTGLRTDISTTAISQTSLPDFGRAPIIPPNCRLPLGQ